MSNEGLDYCWPADFPEGVPENQDVVPAKGRVYRLVKGTPPTESDFRRHRDENTDYVYTTKDMPKSFGVSFWSSTLQCQRIQRNYPKPEQFGNMKIVYGDLCKELGTIPAKPTRDGHITLWVQDGAEPHHHVKYEVEE